MTSHELLLEGLDGSNPLGFLAAIGLLRILSEGRTTEPPTLAWRNEGLWRPVIGSCFDREDLLTKLEADVQGWRGDPVLDLHYPKQEGAEKLAHDLKPRPRRFREYLRGLLTVNDDRRERALAFAAAFATENAVDNNGNVKPTAFHFTAGQQEFLAMIELLVEGTKGVPGVGRSDFEEALWGPWKYQRQLPVLGWDATASRDYALRASDPSGEKKTGVPGADWLAFRGLALLPVAPSGSRIVTPCCHGGWKDGWFQWPLWTVALTVDVVRSVVGRSDLETMTLGERLALGVGIMFRSSIRRSDQGGYGSFTPARVA